MHNVCSWNNPCQDIQSEGDSFLLYQASLYTLNLVLKIADIISIH